jgi:hypothetical protein
MNPDEVCLTLPNFLVPYRNGGVEDYPDSPETVGKLVLAVASKIFKGADITADFTPCERGVYLQWLKVAENALAKANRERAKLQKAAAARWHGGTAARSQQTAKPAPMADGGARRAEDGEGGRVDIGSLAYRDPLTAALLATGETGNARARNTFKKLLREKGARRFRDAVISFEAECRSGEEPNNRGAALTRRLKDLPNDPKGGEA